MSAYKALLAATLFSVSLCTAPPHRELVDPAIEDVQSAHVKFVNHLAWSRGPLNLIASAGFIFGNCGGDSHVIKFWDPVTGKLAFKHVESQDLSINQLAWSPIEDLLAYSTSTTSNSDSYLHVISITANASSPTTYSTHQPTLLPLPENFNVVRNENALAWSLDGTRLAVHMSNRDKDIIKILNLATISWEKETYDASKNIRISKKKVHSLAWTIDPNTEPFTKEAVSITDRHAHILADKSMTPVQTFRHPRKKYNDNEINHNYCESHCYNMDHTLVALQYQDEAVGESTWLWSRSNQLLAMQPKEYFGTIYIATTTPSRPIDNTTETETDQHIATLRGFRPQFSPTNQHLVCYLCSYPWGREGHSKSLLITDLAAGIDWEINPEQQAQSFAWSPDGQTLVVATLGGKLLLYDIGRILMPSMTQILAREIGNFQRPKPQPAMAQKRPRKRKREDSEESAADTEVAYGMISNELEQPWKRRRLNPGTS